MYQKQITLYSLLFIFFLFFVGCQSEQVEQKIEVTEITTKNWKKSKKVNKEGRREGPHNFYALHSDIRTREGETHQRYKTNYKQRALQKALKLNQSRGIAREGLDWIERGPGNVGGRTRGLLIDKRDTTFSTWFAGSAGGGIWKTEDGNQSWRLVSEELPSMSATTLASSDSNPDIIYAGTGEGFGPREIRGEGIFKSTDNGENWVLLEATGNNPLFSTVLRIVVDPNDSDVVLAAIRTGFLEQPDTSLSTIVSSIMKSTDGGTTWKSVYSISGNPVSLFTPTAYQIVADPVDFNILYASIGFAGILKSTDKGENWELVLDAEDTGLEIGRIEIAVSPVNSQYVYLAAESFDEGATLIRSTDAGATWDIILGEYENWLGEQGIYDNTIAAHPYDVNSVFVAGTGAMLRITATNEFVEINSIGAITNNTDFLAFYNPFGGDAISTTKELMIEFFGTELVESPEDLVKVEIRFGPGKRQKAHRHIFDANPLESYQDYVDVPFEVWDLTNNRQLMVSFREEEKDGVWNLNNIGPQNENAFPEVLSIHAIEYDTLPSTELASFFNASYYSVFAGIPLSTTVDMNNLSAGTLMIEPRVQSGFISSFEPITDGYQEYSSFESVASKGVHVDHHNIILIPMDSASGNFYIINANDGGVAFSTDAGATFLQTGDTFKEELNPLASSNQSFPTTIGYNTSQFYGLDKMNGADRYIGGTQDNGSWFSPIDADEKSVWVLAPSGDGFEAAWHYTNSNLILESSQFNNVFRSEDGGATWEQVFLPGIGPFVTRLSASKQDPDLVFAVNDRGILKSTDFGLTWTSTALPSEWVFNGGFNPVEVSLASPKVVWSAGAVNETERIVVSSDGGESFEATSGYPQAKLGLAVNLATHPLNENTAYALFSIADGPKIIMTNDLGKTWTDISGFVGNQEESSNGFPDVATYSLVVMPFDTNQIWAGTEIGLFETLDGGATWHYADNGLPPVSIWEMKIVNDEVILATHGRGIWSVSLPELAGYEPIEVELGPQIVSQGNGFNGIIAGEANLRAAYDSTIITISVPISTEETITKQIFLAANDSPKRIPFDVLLTIESDSIIESKIEIVSYIDETVFKSAIPALVYNVDENPITEYSNDFDEGSFDFARLGFNVYQETGFSDQALHSPHPYSPNIQEVIAVFQKPILVGNSIFSFDEIAIIEPGDSEEFGSLEFYDFVTIEGTTDNGITWTTLDGYDSRINNNWLSIFNNGAPGSPEIIETHSIDLSDFYQDGDIVYLRFRLVSDEDIEGWGWMIDNIELSSEVTAIKELPVDIKLQNYPNPFGNSTVLNYTLAKKSEVLAELYTIDGKRISQLIEASQNAGTHTYHVNTSTLKAGIYICRFMVNGEEKTLKWIKK